eukprot:PhF_6_TR23632/c0_g1_i1/m.33125
MFGDNIMRHHRIRACVSSSLSKLQDDDRWFSVDVMVFKVHQVRCKEEDHVGSFPPSLKSLHVRQSDRKANGCVAVMSSILSQVSLLTSLTSLDLSYCDTVTDTGLA